MSAFLRFAAVGTAGFAVNATALWIALHGLHLPKDLAWFFAFVPAVTFTWWGNRTFTFHEHASHGAAAMLSEWARFVATNGLGALVNYATYAALIRLTALDPLLALACGVLVGLAFNFTLSKRLVFKRHLSSPVLGGKAPNGSEAEGVRGTVGHSPPPRPSGGPPP